MRILSWMFRLFFKKKIHTGISFSLPLDPKRDRALSKIYEKIYWNEMSGVNISDPQKKDILKIINSKYGKSVDLSSIPEIFEKHFSGGYDISWVEYEKWYGIFRKLGKFPVGWGGMLSKGYAEDLSTSESINVFKVKSSEIKNILNELGMDIPQKVKKEQLIELAETANKYDFAMLIPDFKDRLVQYKNKRNHEIFTCLMETIAYRSQHIEEQSHFARDIAKGKCKVELMFAYGEKGDPVGAKYAKKCFAENQNAVPPFFPGDSTTFRYHFKMGGKWV